MIRIEVKNKVNDYRGFNTVVKTETKVYFLGILIKIKNTVNEY